MLKVGEFSTETVGSFRLTQTGFKDITPDEFVAHLVEAEWDDRYNRRLARLIKTAKFRYRASIEDVDFSLARGLD